MERQFACPLPPYPAFERPHPRAWFVKMEAHFFIRGIDSQTERYRITTALLPADLCCEPLKHCERPYGTLEAYEMARLGSSHSHHKDAASPPSMVSAHAITHDGTRTAPSSLPSCLNEFSTRDRSNVAPPLGFAERHLSTFGHSNLVAPTHSTPGDSTMPLDTTALPPRPLFYRKNHEVWLMQMECYFDLYHITAQEERYSLMHELLP